MKNFNHSTNILRLLLIISKQFLNISSANSQPSFKIAGGNPIYINEAKFVVQVLSDSFVCGGSLITPVHVVTAAHCINGTSANTIVIAGATYFNIGGQRTKVRQTYFMDSYSTNILKLDIVVLRLQSPLRGPNIATIELCNTYWQPGDLMQIYGWGDRSSKEIDNDFHLYNKRYELRVTEVPVQEQKKCQDIWHRKLPRTVFCAGILGERDSCEGDSGGPAVFNGQLCGIVSFGYPCPNVGFYVNVHYVKNFVKNVLRVDK